MKKKAIISTVASVVLAGAMCVGFAACGENAESYVSQRVDKEAFVAAFAETNFGNVQFEGTLAVETGEGDSFGKSSAEIKFVIDGNKEHMKATTKYEGIMIAAAGKETAEDEVYYSVGESGSEVTVYAKNEAGVWAIASAGYQTYQPTEFLSDLLLGEEDYELFAFNEEKKGYYYEEGDESVLVKFKDGKLYSYKATQKISQGAATMTKNFVFTFGGQSVTLPSLG